MRRLDPRAHLRPVPAAEAELRSAAVADAVFFALALRGVPAWSGVCARASARQASLPPAQPPVARGELRAGPAAGAPGESRRGPTPTLATRSDELVTSAPATAALH